MRLLYDALAPDVSGAEDDVVARYAAVDRPPPDGRPWVVVNMVASLDGSVIDPLGRSGGLSGPADRAVFHALRAAADVILVGAGTARAENYGPVRISDTDAARRTARGQTHAPVLAVVTGTVDLDPSMRLFEDPTRRPIVLTTETLASRHRDRLAGVAELRGHGTHSVDLGAALSTLRQEGHGLVLCEGGPALNGSLARIDAIDELCLSSSPVLVGGTTHGLVTSDGPCAPTPWTLVHIVEDRGMLFLRYLCAR